MCCVVLAAPVLLLLSSARRGGEESGPGETGRPPGSRRGVAASLTGGETRRGAGASAASKRHPPGATTCGTARQRDGPPSRGVRNCDTVGAPRLATPRRPSSPSSSDSLRSATGRTYATTPPVAALVDWGRGEWAAAGSRRAARRLGVFGGRSGGNARAGGWLVVAWWLPAPQCRDCRAGAAPSRAARGGRNARTRPRRLFSPERAVQRARGGRRRRLISSRVLWELGGCCCLLDPHVLTLAGRGTCDRRCILSLPYRYRSSGGFCGLFVLAGDRKSAGRIRAVA